MAKFILDIPDDLHDQLRIEKVNQKKDIKDIVIDAIEKGLKN